MCILLHEYCVVCYCVNLEIYTIEECEDFDYQTDFTHCPFVNVKVFTGLCDYCCQHYNLNNNNNNNNNEE